MTHKELVERAVIWLKRIGCSAIISELHSSAQEIPDTIGWRSGKSILVECKTSRSDFMSDWKKPWRLDRKTGMGDWRFYMCKPGIISQNDIILKSWGLIHINGDKFKRVLCPKGNCNWGSSPFEANCRSEVKLLVSKLRRMDK